MEAFLNSLSFLRGRNPCELFYNFQSHEQTLIAFQAAPLRLPTGQEQKHILYLHDLLLRKVQKLSNIGPNVMSKKSTIGCNRNTSSTR